MKKETLPFETTWMDIEDFMPSDISQSQKDKYILPDLTCTWDLK